MGNVCRDRRRGWVAVLVGFGMYSLATGLAVAQVSQPPAKIGILWITSAEEAAPYLGAVKHGLRELGWFEGRNIVFVERFEQGDQSRFPKLAAELVALGVEDQRRPTLKRVSELEKIAEQKEREQGKDPKLDDFMKTLSIYARKRQAKDYGYGDKGEKWTALPEPVRELVKGINEVPPDARGSVLERIRDNLQRNPEWVKEMTQQLEGVVVAETRGKYAANRRSSNYGSSSFSI